MRTLIVSHTNLIDRIDYLVNETNHNLIMVNKEIGKVPSKYGGLKDKVIIVLLLLLLSLLIIVSLKVYRKRVKFERIYALNDRKEVLR